MHETKFKRNTELEPVAMMMLMMLMMLTMIDMVVMMMMMLTVMMMERQLLKKRSGETFQSYGSDTNTDSQTNRVGNFHWTKARVKQSCEMSRI